MDISKISAGKNVPDEINVIVEIPMNSDPVKYEFDKESGAILVDRFMQVAMSYPCNYGFVPHTLGGDGDPIDVLVISLHPVVPSSIIRCRPIGVLMMEDESGEDEKILAVPVSKVDPSMDIIHSYEDLNPYLLKRIVHFFETYKDLEQGKWVKILGWDGAPKARELIVSSIKRASGAAGQNL
ncbi:MAG: inorganic diphosphatase [Alphaproteobacteria bacterium]|nr:inorganic diphosphatase [Alphaproteobacteria bacterium]